MGRQVCFSNFYLHSFPLLGQMICISSTTVLSSPYSILSRPIKIFAKNWNKMLTSFLESFLDQVHVKFDRNGEHFVAWLENWLRRDIGLSSLRDHPSLQLEGDGKERNSSCPSSSLDFIQLRSHYQRAGLRVMTTALGLESMVYAYGRMVYGWEVGQIRRLLVGERRRRDKTEEEGGNKENANSLGVSDDMGDVIPFVVSNIPSKSDSLTDALPESLAVDDFRNFLRLLNTGDFGLILAAEFHMQIYNHREKLQSNGFSFSSSAADPNLFSKSHLLSPTDHVYYQYDALVEVFMGKGASDRVLREVEKQKGSRRADQPNPERTFLHNLAQPLFLGEFTVWFKRFAISIGVVLLDLSRGGFFRFV